MLYNPYEIIFIYDIIKIWEEIKKEWKWLTNTIYIVRHGQTEWNILGKTQGHGDSNLTAKGREQAELLAESRTK